MGGQDLARHQQQARRLIGYCPQFDALLDRLTVREHLALFARVKGVPEQRLDREVRDWMARLRLLPFEHKLAETLSGGNRRKLSVGIALVGDPEVVFLDEPSTGVPAGSRA